ncbi:MAG TPA: hypothetical protein VFZ77_09800 [Acidimicrobiales bacterium]
MASDASTSSILVQVLESTAYRIAEHGTWSESAVLEALADAARDRCPVGAAALVDWEAPEVTRLRAYSIVHGILLREPADVGRHETAAQVVEPQTSIAV